MGTTPPQVLTNGLSVCARPIFGAREPLPLPGIDDGSASDMTGGERDRLMLGVVTRADAPTARVSEASVRIIVREGGSDETRVA